METFELRGVPQSVAFSCTVNVAPGVVCDEYGFISDKTKDLGIIHIKPGHSTPRQKVTTGEVTIEGYVWGEGIFVVNRSNGETETYGLGPEAVSRLEVEVNVGDVIQWIASPAVGLIAYEVCFPPFEEGRFVNL